MNTAEQRGKVIHALASHHIIRMAFCNNIIFIRRGCWFDVMRMENFTYMI